jgi:hypothetical protein
MTISNRSKLVIALSAVVATVAIIAIFRSNTANQTAAGIIRATPAAINIPALAARSPAAEGACRKLLA